MKKIYVLFCVLICSANLLYSQSQRLVLLEEFTQASCGPCATANPPIEALLNSNPTKITSVWYHTSWPGYDPMYLQNPADPSARVGYYGVGYVPYSDLDGNYYSGSATGWNINTVNARYAVPSPFNLQLMHVISPAHDTVYLTMVAKATADVAGSLVAHNVVIEKTIHFNSPPGSNGEKDFPNVVKKMLPSNAGTTLSSALSTGDYQIIESFWKLANVYDITQLAAVGFIQNNATKETHQSCNSSTSMPVMPYANDLQPLEITNVSQTSCMGTVSPKVKIRNNGNNTVTTFKVNYKVNDGNLSTYTWNGNLTTLQKTIITLPAYTFDPSQNNILKIYTSNPNSVSDQYAKNDSLTMTIIPAKHTTNTLTLLLYTDNNPQQTTWDVKNSLGQVVQSGGPYAQPATIYQENITLPQADCFTFTMYDSYGNGICCYNGNGMYQLKDSQSTLIKEGGSFEFTDPAEFRMDTPSAIEEFDRSTALTVYPNPFIGSTTVSFYLVSKDNVKLELYSVIGKSLKTIELGTLSSGQHDFILDASTFQPGFYFIRMETGSKVYTRKITVSD